MRIGVQKPVLHSPRPLNMTRGAGKGRQVSGRDSRGRGRGSGRGRDSRGSRGRKWVRGRGQKPILHFP